MKFIRPLLGAILLCGLAVGQIAAHAAQPQGWGGATPDDSTRNRSITVPAVPPGTGLSPPPALPSLVACPSSITVWGNVPIPLKNANPSMAAPDGHAWCHYEGTYAGDTFAGAFDRVEGRAVSYIPIFDEVPNPGRSYANPAPSPPVTHLLRFTGQYQKVGVGNSTNGGAKCANDEFDALHNVDCGYTSSSNTSRCVVRTASDSLLRAYGVEIAYGWWRWSGDSQRGMTWWDPWDPANPYGGAGAFLVEFHMSDCRDGAPSFWGQNSGGVGGV